MSLVLAFVAGAAAVIAIQNVPQRPARLQPDHEPPTAEAVRLREGQTSEVSRLPLPTSSAAKAIHLLPAESVSPVVEFSGRDWPAKLATIGVLAEGSTGLIPILLEMQNPDESLRCGIRVQVRFSQPLAVQP